MVIKTDSFWSQSFVLMDKSEGYRKMAILGFLNNFNVRILLKNINQS